MDARMDVRTHGWTRGREWMVGHLALGQGTARRQAARERDKAAAQEQCEEWGEVPSSAFHSPMYARS